MSTTPTRLDAAQPASLRATQRRPEPSASGRAPASFLGARRVMAALAVGMVFAALLADPAAAQALEPVVRGATIIRDTVVAVALLVLTAAVGIAGYRIAFSGASFRDVSSLVVGGAIAGGAAAIAGIFMG